MTFEEAKKAVAEARGYSTFEELNNDATALGVNNYYSKAAELMNKSNLERIEAQKKEIERLNEVCINQSKIYLQSNVEQVERIKELEDGLKELVQQCDTLGECEIPNTEQAKQLLK